MLRRVVQVDLLRTGTSIAMATIRHLVALFQGTEDSYVSMGVLAPEGDLYYVPKGTPFSFPVTAKDGHWKVVEVNDSYYPLMTCALIDFSDTKVALCIYIKSWFFSRG